MNKIKIRRVFLCLISATFSLTLSGCWNYRGLDQMNIVVGVAVDFDDKENLYDVSYEVASLSGEGKESGTKGRIINSQGRTMFDAVRNAKRREADRLFFGSPHVLVINQQVAREIGILGIIDWFIRDGEGRETMCVAISQEDTAVSMLENSGDSMEIVSANLHDIMREDKDITGTTLQVEMYNVLNILNSERKSILLPALRKAQNEDDKVPEVNGSAIIKKDKLIGFLSPNQSKYALIIEEKLGSAIITLSMANTESDDISLEIFKNKSNKSYTYKDGKIAIKIKTETHVSVVENHGNMDMMDREIVKKIEKAAGDKIKLNIEGVISTLKREFNTDVFGFGEMIYKKDQKLWKELSPMWDEIYPTLEVDVISDVKIVNSAFIK